MAYDEGRGRIVLFGGTSGVDLNDTWEHDGSAWIRRTPAVNPPASALGSMAYDPVRGVTLLSTGAASGTDFWRWDGENWSQAASLPPQQQAVPQFVRFLAWHGGANPGVITTVATLLTIPGETWRFDGNSWVMVNSFPVGAGPQWGGGTGAFVPATGLTYCLEGGFMWAWNGSTWQTVTQTGDLTVGGPNSRMVWDAAIERFVVDWLGTTFGEILGPTSVHWTRITTPNDPAGALVHDTQRARTLQFGSTQPSQTDLYRLEVNTSAASWQILPTLPSSALPIPRVYTDMAFDAPSGRMVMCAGQGPFGLQNDTWTFNGTTWTDHGPSQNVTPRMQPAIVHAPNLGTVLFGGGTGTGTYFGDTWFWVGTDWFASLLSGAPPPRMGHDMVFDSVRNEVFLHGGYDGAARDDTWVMRPSPTFGAQWVQVATTGSPIPRQSHAMAFDARRGRVVVFGGADQNIQFLGDTWECVPSLFGVYQWVQRFPAQSPPRRWQHKMDYDPARGVVVLTGGYGNPQCGQFCATFLNDVWEYDGDTWRQRSPSTALPAGREGAAFAYDSQRQRFVMQGGKGGGVFQQETWYYTAPNDRFGEGMQGGSTMKLRCTKFPVAGQSTAFAFDTQLGIGWLTVFVGPAPQPGLTLGAGLLCGTGTFYGVGAVVVDAMGFPGTTSFTLPPATAGLGFVAQGISLENGFCLRLTDPLAVTIHAP